MKTFKQIREEQQKLMSGIGGLTFSSDIWDKFIEIEKRLKKLEMRK